MSAKSRSPKAGSPKAGSAAAPLGPAANGSAAVSPRRPCPCGSGKRYKACHGADGGAADVIVTRPFGGLAAECQLVALREFVPSATAPLPLTDPGELGVTLATVLPMAAAAIVQADGSMLVGLQVQTRSGDVSRDLGRAVRWALDAEPGDVLPVVNAGTAGGAEVRLQDLLAPDARLDVTMHPDFSWWVPGGAPPSGEVALSLERANAAIMPTEAVTSDGAYWVDAGEKAHIRWVRPEPEERLLAAMARLAARDQLDLGEGSRYAGSFRAHGVLVPVWDLDRERHARQWVPGAEAFASRLDGALASLDGEPLAEPERRARDGLRGRQVTLR
ncbi:MAG: hypothetical protein GEV09_19790 [Pseudonocardiaceae bacterium]|nr:hypothetical protein [Pseudonocardiaceae bacterium]